MAAAWRDGFARITTGTLRLRVLWLLNLLFGLLDLGLL
jgi:hypothetical protein